MSSTTDRRRERGQVLAIFAFGAVGILAIAALVFDVGYNLYERRRHQNAADAAALAGARFLTVAGCRIAPSAATCAQAVAAAVEIAVAHGYHASQVQVNAPPDARSNHTGESGHIQVLIESDRGSYFAGVVGITAFRVSAIAVASNTDEYPIPYSFLALDPHTCKAGHIHGNGSLVVEGAVHVVSDCTSPGAFVFDGNPVVGSVSGTCSAGGTVEYGANSNVTCASEVENVLPAPDDPLAALDAPMIGSSIVPDPPATPVVVNGLVTMAGCPGTAAAEVLALLGNGCTLNAIGFGAGVRIYPGVYYGGINISPNNPLTVYMEPGIYYIAGGGFEIAGNNATVVTVDAGTTTTGGGIMIFNTDAPTCGSGGPCIGPIDVQNVDAGSIDLRPYQGVVYDRLVLFQDRDASAQPPLKLSGTSVGGFTGGIYLPEAGFEFTGNGSAAIMHAQVIAWTFDVGGNGDLTVEYDPPEAVKQLGAALVQ